MSSLNATTNIGVNGDHFSFLTPKTGPQYTGAVLYLLNYFLATGAGPHTGEIQTGD
jgi:hypothetical protein